MDLLSFGWWQYQMGAAILWWRQKKGESDREIERERGKKKSWDVTGMWRFLRRRGYFNHSNREKLFLNLPFTCSPCAALRLLVKETKFPSSLAWVPHSLGNKKRSGRGASSKYWGVGLFSVFSVEDYVGSAFLQFLVLAHPRLRPSPSISFIGGRPPFGLQRSQTLWKSRWCHKMKQARN